MSTILVTGDFLVDHHIYQGRRHHFGDLSSPGVCVKEELGGGALIHRLLSKLGLNAHWKSILAVEEDEALQKMRECISPGSDCFDQQFSAYAFWRPYPLKKQAKKGEEMRWRVAEAMGFGGGAVTSGQWPWGVSPKIPGAPEILVISDGGMGFRSRRNASNWRIPMPKERLAALFQADSAAEATPPPQEPRWVILKMSAPVAEGDLWRELSHHHADRLIVVVSAAELRRANVKLSRGLSWEQTLEDLHAALQNNPGLQSLLACRHLVISFESEGALCLSRQESHHKAAFIFDPEKVEGEGKEDFDGDVYGHLSCLTATVAAAVATAPDAPDLPKAMRQGLTAMRHLRQHGHGDAEHKGAGFPVESLTTAIAAMKVPGDFQIREFVCNDASCPVRKGWSLLALYEQQTPTSPSRPLFGIARRVLIQGPKVLQAPTLAIGDFFTTDRGEIEALRSLRQLVRRYLRNRKADKPLSIGVFGPPGAGKSFAVKELAASLLGEELGWLEFNLSQFNGPADLIGALHQVRDKILEGKRPVAFFDEFDSQNFEWLKYLLAPMQDGRFQEGPISHPVGQCLFVFAGGTSHTFEEFAAKGNAAKKPSDPFYDDARHFVLAKGPDFSSRLDARLNVIGPNPLKPLGKSCVTTDIFYPVRRALLIRSRLKCKPGARLTIHPGLATALLELSKYKHGARSLSKLVEPYKALRSNNPDAPLELTHLLPSDQLSLHVPPEEFDELIRRDEETAYRLGVDKLAAAVHGFYRKQGVEGKWIKPQHDCEFPQLSPFDQASNRAAARRIPSVLALAALRLEEGIATPDERNAAEAAIEFHREILAEAEHDGWMDWHLDNGWTQAPQRHDGSQLHDLLVAFSDLNEKQKSKDRDSVKFYPQIADLAGFKILPIQPPTTGTSSGEGTDISKPNE